MNFGIVTWNNIIVHKLLVLCIVTWSYDSLQKIIIIKYIKSYNCLQIISAR